MVCFYSHTKSLQKYYFFFIYASVRAIFYKKECFF